MSAEEARLRFGALYLSGLVMDWEYGLPLGTFNAWALKDIDLAVSATESAGCTALRPLGLYPPGPAAAPGGCRSNKPEAASNSGRLAKLRVGLGKGRVMSLVLRMCASYANLSREDCVVPERCVERLCALCGRPVHYDPKGSIPILGQELIVCDNDDCLSQVLEATGSM